MTASELVERLQMIIKKDGDFEVEWRDFDIYEKSSYYFYSVDNVEIMYNSSVKSPKRIIGLY